MPLNPFGCAAIPMSPPEAAKISFPVAMFKLSSSGAGFSKLTQDALNAPFARVEALGSVSGLNVYRAVTPEEIAPMHGETYLRAEGWKPAFAGNGIKSLGEGRFVGLYSDGKADIVVRVEPSPGWPRDDMPGSQADRAKLRELASRGEAVVYRYEGRGIAKAACAGNLPEVMGFTAPGSTPAAKPL